jgi:hypothetical protein
MNTIKWRPKNLRRFEKWLGEMGLQEKLRTLEKGMLVQCIKCLRVFFNEESTEDRNMHRCRSGEHNCFECGQYVVLRRGFKGIIWATSSDSRDTLAEAILNFFKNLK